MSIPGTSAIGPSGIFKLYEIIDSAQRMMLTNGSLAPVFFIKLSSEDKSRCYPIPEHLFNSAEGKDSISHTIHKYVEDLKPDSLVFLSEAWVKVFKVKKAGEDLSVEDIKEEASKCIEGINEAGGLASLPRTEKEEVVMISASDYTKEPVESFTGLIKVIRDRAGVVRNFNPPEWIKANTEAASSGRFNFG